MPTHPSKVFAEFFAGIGLMRMGLERAGWKVAYANDIDPQKQEMYLAHFRDANEHFFLDDVHKLDATEIPTVSLATASFPCNDLSLAGGRQGLAGENSSAFWGFIKVLHEMGGRRPKMVLLENVTGFLTSHGGQDLCDALMALNKLGYSVDPFILDAAWFVPQSRQRLFIVGTRSGRGATFKVEENGFFESPLRPQALSDFIFLHPEIQWNIRELPAPPVRRFDLESIIEPVDHDSPLWWSVERAEYLVNQMSDRHRDQAKKMIAGKTFTYGTVFRRVRNGKSMAELRVDGVAGCLRTPRGGSGRQILFKAGRGRYYIRLLTPRECARLMGADNFNIDVPLNQALFGFGDAVCVPAVEWIGHHYLNPVLDEVSDTSGPVSSVRGIKYGSSRIRSVAA